jgi:hypothetical protein
MRKIFPTLFCFLILLHCSSEGLLETEDTVNMRDSEVQRYNENRILFIANKCWEPEQKSNLVCLMIIVGIPYEEGICEGPYLPYPWTKSNECIGK